MLAVLDRTGRNQVSSLLGSAVQLTRVCNAATLEVAEVKPLTIGQAAQVRMAILQAATKVGQILGGVVDTTGKTGQPRNEQVNVSN